MNLKNKKITKIYSKNLNRKKFNLKINVGMF